MTPRNRHDRLAFSVLLSASLFWALPAAAEILFKADFETGDLRQFSGQSKKTRRGDIEVVTEIVHSGKYAGRITIHEDDVFNARQLRAQLNGPKVSVKEGSDTFVSFFMYMKEAPKDRDNFFYWEGSPPPRYNNVMTWWVGPKEGGSGSFIKFGTGNLGRKGVHWEGDFTIGQWHQLGMHIHWSEDPAVGNVTLWWDGVTVLDKKVQTKGPQSVYFSQPGIHRDPHSKSVDTIYFDDFLCDTTLEEIKIQKPSAKLSFHAPPGNRLLFTSQGKTGMINADGTGLRYFQFDRPGQATWQPGGTLDDGRRILFLSMEPRRDGPGRPFDEYYTQTPTHIWIHDLETGSLEEICTKDRLAPFETPALILKHSGRLLVQVVRKNVGQIYSVRLDGSDPREFTRAGEGLPYGMSLNPDGNRVAYHLASPRGYQVWTSDTDGTNRVKIAGRPGHLYFGTSWSPDGRFILYLDCRPDEEPGHDWADVCVGRADGSEHRVLTSGKAMWFAATYGDPKSRGGGSNVPAWTRDGSILYPRRLPGSRVPWEFQPRRPDVDHFNRDYKPELARGGTEICRLDPRDGRLTVLTRNEPPCWDFRASESPDGKYVVFCRAKTGGPPAIWVMDADGKNPREITRGLDNLGADHPRWL